MVNNYFNPHLESSENEAMMEHQVFNQQPLKSEVEEISVRSIAA